MALIINRVCDFTGYVLKGILHVILRDLTNYYWYLEKEQEELEQLIDAYIDNQTENYGILLPSNLKLNHLGSNQENIHSDFVCNNECDCLESNQDNTQRIQELVNNKKCEDGLMANEILPIIDNFCLLNIVGKPSDNFDEMSIEDNSMIQNEEDNSNRMTYSVNKNCMWTEIENDFCENKKIINDDKNITEEKSPQTFLETLERESIENSPLDNLSLGAQLGEKCILQTNYQNMYDEANVNITYVKDTERQHELKNYEKEENVPNSDRFIFELQNGDKSGESNECGFGRHNYFQCQNLYDNCPIVENSDSMSQMNETCESQPGKSKVSRYVHNTTLPSIKTTEEPYSPAEMTILKPPTNSLLEEIENEHLPHKSYEINGITPLLNKSQELLESESNVTMESTQLENNPSEVFGTPEEEGDCSNDSWDDWLSRFSTIIKPKTPTTNDDASSIKPSSSTEEDEKEDFCDCVNSHSCLLNVDSDVDLAEELLTPEQLGSVETGSVSDWLYRVNPPYPLLPTTRESEETPQEIQNTKEQEQNTSIHSESSGEDLAVKNFFIEQWLDKTETYNNTGLNTKFIGSGNIICS